MTKAKKQHITTLSMTMEDVHRIDALRLMQATERGELPATKQAVIMRAVRQYLDREMPLT